MILKTKFSSDEIKEIIIGLEKWIRPNIVITNNIAKDTHALHYFIGDYLSTRKFHQERFWEDLKTYPEFDFYYEYIKELQEYKLLNNGLNKKVDSTILKFVLANKHNYKEKTENSNTDKITLENFKLKDLNIGFGD